MAKSPEERRAEQAAKRLNDRQISEQRRTARRAERSQRNEAQKDRAQQARLTQQDLHTRREQWAADRAQVDRQIRISKVLAAASVTSVIVSLLALAVSIVALIR